MNVPNVVLETVKKAEDGDGVILWMYECENARTPVTLTFNRPFASAESCNCLEEPDGEPVKVDGNKVSFLVKPFEIKTIRIR